MTTQNGFAIRAFRQTVGLTPVNMADVLGVSSRHYRKLEAETREAQPAQIAAIAKALNVTPAAIVRTPPGAESPDPGAGLRPCCWDGTHPGAPCPLGGQPIPTQGARP